MILWCILSISFLGVFWGQRSWCCSLPLLIRMCFFWMSLPTIWICNLDKMAQCGSVWLSGSQTEESFGVFCLATFFTAKAVAAGVTMSSQVADWTYRQHAHHHATLATKQQARQPDMGKHTQAQRNFHAAWRSSEEVCTEQKARLASDCLETRPWTKINKGTRWFHTRQQMMYASPMQGLRWQASQVMRRMRR